MHSPARTVSMLRRAWQRRATANVLRRRHPSPAPFIWDDPDCTHCPPGVPCAWPTPLPTNGETVPRTHSNLNTIDEQNTWRHTLDACHMSDIALPQSTRDLMEAVRVPAGLFRRTVGDSPLTGDEFLGLLAIWGSVHAHNNTLPDSMSTETWDLRSGLGLGLFVRWLRQGTETGPPGTRPEKTRLFSPLLAECVGTPGTRPEKTLHKLSAGIDDWACKIVPLTGRFEPVPWFIAGQFTPDDAATALTVAGPTFVPANVRACATGRSVYDPSNHQHARLIDPGHAAVRTVLPADHAEADLPAWENACGQFGDLSILVGDVSLDDRYTQAVALDHVRAWVAVAGRDAPLWLTAGYTLTQTHQAITNPDPGQRLTRDQLAFLAGLS